MHGVEWWKSPPSAFARFIAVMLLALPLLIVLDWASRRWLPRTVYCDKTGSHVFSPVGSRRLNERTEYDYAVTIRFDSTGPQEGRQTSGMIAVSVLGTHRNAVVVFDAATGRVQQSDVAEVHSGETDVDRVVGRMYAYVDLDETKSDIHEQAVRLRQIVASVLKSPYRMNAGPEFAAPDFTRAGFLRTGGGTTMRNHVRYHQVGAYLIREEFVKTCNLLIAGAAAFGAFVAFGRRMSSARAREGLKQRQQNS